MHPYIHIMLCSTIQAQDRFGRLAPTTRLHSTLLLHIHYYLLHLLSLYTLFPLAFHPVLVYIPYLSPPHSIS